MSNIVKAKLRLRRNVKSALVTRWDSDEPIVTTDTGELFIGMGETVDAIKISDFIQVDALPLVGMTNKIYVVKSTRQAFYWNGTQHVIIAGQGGVISYTTFSTLPATGIEDTIYVVKTDESFYPTTETSLYIWDSFNADYLLISRAMPTSSFSEINVDGIPILATNVKDTINLKAGLGITLDADADSKTITINQSTPASATINKEQYTFSGGVKGNITNSLGIMSSARVNDNIYLMGGYNGSVCTNSFQCYNVTTNTCKSIGTIPTARYSAGSFTYNGNVYMAGGYNGSASLNEFWMYDVSNLVWVNKPKLNVTRCISFCGLIGDKYWMISGYLNSSTRTPTIEYYDFNLDCWVLLDASHNIPTPRYGGQTFIFDNLIYCVGGYDTSNTYSTKVEVFDTVNLTWTTKANMPVSRYAGASATYNGLGYIFAGSQSGTYTRTLYVYNPTVDKWYLKENMTTSRMFACVERFDNTFYVLGGQTGSSSNTVITEAYSVASDIVANFATVNMLYPTGSMVLNTVTGESAKYLGLNAGEGWHYGAWDSNGFKAIVTEMQS